MSDKKNVEKSNLLGLALTFQGEQEIRLLEKVEKGFYGWDTAPKEELLKALEQKVGNLYADETDHKKALIDIANFAMFLWNRFDKDSPNA